MQSRNGQQQAAGSREAAGSAGPGKIVQPELERSAEQDRCAREQRFVELISDEVYERAWRYCLRLCIRREDSQDLLQESLAQAFAKLDQLRDAEQVGAWLMSIIRRRYIRRWQREQSRPPAVDELPELAAADHVDPFAEQVRVALTQLPQPQRELLELYYLEGFDMQECGKVLGIGPRVVKQRLYRARQAMRRMYSPHKAAGDFSSLL
jgi:RNA polymerase sigma-70 factor (ECF subfamily)